MTTALPPVVAWPAGVILAALLGSFLNVCISRLPRGESVVLPSSHCPACRSPIRAVDNIPLVSYLVLGGRCRACGATISWRYPLVEALAIAMGALTLWQLGPTWAAARAFLLCLVMIAVAFTDLETRRIPDRITLPGIVGACILAPEGLSRGSAGAAVGAVAFALITVMRARGAARRGETASPEPDPAEPDPPEPDPVDEVDPAELRRLDIYWATAWGALAGRQLAVVSPAGLMAGDLPLTWRALSQIDPLVAGCLITGGMFFVVAWVSHVALGRTGLGGGDIKLAALIGAALGAGVGLVAAFVGIMLGGVVAAALLVTGRRRFGEYLPFGPFLAAGGVVAAIWGEPLLRWYLG
jgi:prepilin signal peptidase PulO-like enzyme (type II secretory pathway)